MIDLNSCEQVQERLAEYLDDTSALRGRRWVDRHLLHCSDCTKQLRQIRWTIDRLRKLPPERISPTRKSALLCAFSSPRSA